MTSMFISHIWSYMSLQEEKNDVNFKLKALDAFMWGLGKGVANLHILGNKKAHRYIVRKTITKTK